MKLNQTQKTLETNAQFTSQEFSIGDTSKIIEILRNKMYKFKVRTPSQEYICNARDAMRELGSSDRIEITVPTIFTPTFKVRDFGPGITPDRMLNVFIKYDASTKDKSNKETGGFGIGAKSAWSYTESFTVVTYIDGVQRTYIAHIGANNNGRLDYLGEANTDQPNGTEIQIPVSPKDVEEFKNAARRAVYFWPEKEQPILKGFTKEEVVPRVQGETIGNVELCTELPNYIADHYGKKIVISIDGIPYVAGESLIASCPNLKLLKESVTSNIVLHVGNGEIEVGASREEISDSKYTLDNLDKIAAEAHKNILARLKKEFAKVTSPFEHLTTFMTLKDKYNLDSFRKYGDYTVDAKNQIQSPLFEKIIAHKCQFHPTNNSLLKDNLFKKTRYSWSYSTPYINAVYFDALYYNDTTEAMVITNYRIKDFLKTNKHLILFSKHKDDKGEFDKVKKDLGLKPLSSLAFTKPDRKARESMKVERTKKQFIVHRMDRVRHTMLTVSTESNTTKWLFVEKTDLINKSELHEMDTYFSAQGFKVCALSKQAISLVKGDANFIPLETQLAKVKATKKDVAVLKLKEAKNTDMMSSLLNVTGIKDKFLNKMIAEYKEIMVDSRSATYDSIPTKILKIFGQQPDVDTFNKEDAELTKKLKEYPLLDAINHANFNKLSDDIALYINSK